MGVVSLQRLPFNLSRTWLLRLLEQETSNLNRPPPHLTMLTEDKLRVRSSTKDPMVASTIGQLETPKSSSFPAFQPSCCTSNGQQKSSFLLDEEGKVAPILPRSTLVSRFTTADLQCTQCGLHLPSLARLHNILSLP